MSQKISQTAFGDLTIELELRIVTAAREIEAIDDIDQLKRMCFTLWASQLEQTKVFHEAIYHLERSLSSRPKWLKFLEKMWLAVSK